MTSGMETAEPRAGRLRRLLRASRWRVATVGFCLLVVMFIGISTYYRDQVEKRLNSALDEKPMLPTQAYNVFREINGYSNILTMGRKREAQEHFIHVLQQSVLRALNYRPAPNEGAFQMAQQAVNVFVEMRDQTNLELRAQLDSIILAAKDAVPSIRDAGTLSAWNQSRDFFVFLHENGLTEPGLFGNFEDWMHKTFDIPKRPLVLREAFERATNEFRAALLMLGLTPVQMEGTALALGVPQPLSDEQLMSVEQRLDEAASKLTVFDANFPHQQPPPELTLYEAKLHYNKGALKLAHLLERGEALRKIGSEYVAYETISRNQPGIRDATSLYSMFVQLAVADFQEADRLMIRLDEAEKPEVWGLRAIAHWNMAWLMKLGHADDRAIRSELDRLIAASLEHEGGNPADLIQQMQNSPSPLLIVRLP